MSIKETKELLENIGYKEYKTTEDFLNVILNITTKENINSELIMIVLRDLRKVRNPCRGNLIVMRKLEECLFWLQGGITSKTKD